MKKVLLGFMALAMMGCNYIPFPQAKIQTHAYSTGFNAPSVVFDVVRRVDKTTKLLLSQAVGGGTFSNVTADMNSLAGSLGVNINQIEVEFFADNVSLVKSLPASVNVRLNSGFRCARQDKAAQLGILVIPDCSLNVDTDIFATDGIKPLLPPNISLWDPTTTAAIQNRVANYYNTGGTATTPGIFRASIKYNGVDANQLPFQHTENVLIQVTFNTITVEV